MARRRPTCGSIRRARRLRVRADGQPRRGCERDQDEKTSAEPCCQRIRRINAKESAKNITGQPLPDRSDQEDRPRDDDRPAVSARARARASSGIRRSPRRAGRAPLRESRELCGRHRPRARRRRADDRRDRPAPARVSMLVDRLVAASRRTRASPRPAPPRADRTPAPARRPGCAPRRGATVQPSRVEALEPARPDGRRQPRAHRLRRRPAARARVAIDRVEQPQRDGGVGLLVVARQRERHRRDPRGRAARRVSVRISVAPALRAHRARSPRAPRRAAVRRRPECPA